MAPKERRPDPPADFDPYEFYGIDRSPSSNQPNRSSSTRFLDSAVEEEIHLYDQWQQWAKNKPSFRNSKQNDQECDLLADHVDDCVALFMQFRMETHRRRIIPQSGRRGLLDPN